MTNALTDPWIPVHRDGTDQLVSLHTALADAHHVTGLAESLDPLTRACLHRFLDSAAAYGLQGLDADDVDDFGDTGIYPAEALARIDERTDRFELTHDSKPFLQAWGYAAPGTVVKTSRGGAHSYTKGFLPVGQLDVHVAGDTGSKLGTRAPAETMSHAEVLLSLVVTWFSSKWSNRAPLPGLRPSVSGSPTSNGMGATEFHWIGEHLGLTIAAGVLESWTHPGRAQTPAWLDQLASPTLRELTATPDSLWRTTYTPNRPYVVFDADGIAIAWGIGATDGTYGPIPPLGDAKAKADRTPRGLSDREKSGIKAVHEDDPYRLHLDVTRRKGRGKTAVETIERETYTNYAHSLLSTRTALTWYELGFSSKLAAWGTDRVAQTSHRSPAWRLGVFMELCDKKGGIRFRSTWVTISPAALTVTGTARESALVTLNFLAKIRAEVTRAVMRACAGDASLAEPATARVLAALDDFTLDALTRTAAGEELGFGRLRDAQRIAETELAAALAPYATPDRVADVAAAQGRFTERLSKARPRPEHHEGTGAATSPSPATGAAA